MRMQHEQYLDNNRWHYGELKQSLPIFFLILFIFFLKKSSVYYIALECALLGKERQKVEHSNWTLVSTNCLSKSWTYYLNFSSNLLFIKFYDIFFKQEI